MESVVAVILTYNRLELLKRAVAAVKLQTVPITNIVVIDNGSNDGTTEWLAGQSDISVKTIANNIGASGGYHYGIKAAYAMNTNWIWVMDDDTICQEDTLEKLVNKIPLVTDGNIGFIGSKCYWIDGKPHLMNIPEIKPKFNGTMQFNLYDQHKLLLIESNSWVSLLINSEAVWNIGLPYKEFFFWSDDLEYTQRITKNGYLGLYASDSSVVHATTSNYCPDFYHESVENIWKYSYGFRNEFFLKKKSKGGLFFAFWIIAKLGYTSIKLIKIKKENRFMFIRILLQSAYKSLFFNPKIDKLQIPKQQ